MPSPFTRWLDRILGDRPSASAEAIADALKEDRQDSLKARYPEVMGLYNFRQMLKHLETGGAAFRYGSAYPIYYGRLLSWIDSETKQQHNGHRIEKRYDGGSNGEMVQYNGIQFSVEEQHSINWVFIPKDEWELRDQRMQAFYQEQQLKKQK